MTLSAQSTRVSYSGNGSTTDFVVPFEYFDTTSFVRAYLRNENVTPATETLLVYTTDYTINTGTDLLTMGTAPASGYKLLIRLNMTLSQVKDYITNGSFLQEDHEDGLDRIVAMIQYISEEVDRSAKMLNSSSASGPKLPELSTKAGSLLIVNSAEDGYDTGITYAAFLADVALALAAAASSAASAASASSSASTASSAATSASSSASAAATSATDASNSATAASNSATAASNSASAASTSASNASTSETNAANSATSASTSASAASTSASAASTSASNASTSATNASNSASAASTSAGNAATSETNAAASAASAAASAGSAAGVTTFGTQSSPKAIVAGTGLRDASSNMDTTKPFVKTYVSGAGGVDITASPQVQAGTLEGQELTLIGTSDTNTVLVEAGTGLILQGPALLRKNYRLKISWDSTQALWCEESRNF